ncbi:hypothetical protein BGZ95_002510 [Linnemannia exigua]|uniref:Uncharacterized protein n=1 Tax=Linnemannia exigua TaxID=604196 RepID=A0AAD4D5T7_9FUNG|nr:hypothetical protein BGZ95_002510 [Linnemannia exigua]
MSPTLYRFIAAEGLIHLLDRKTIASSTTPDPNIRPPPHPIATSASPQHLIVHAVHNSTSTLNGTAPVVSNFATKEISSFNHLVCDFDETITDHDTTSSFDTLACRVRPETDYQEPQMTWSEILQAYLDDLEKVDVSDLCHLIRPLDPPPATTVMETGASQDMTEMPTVQISSPPIAAAGKEQESQLHHPKPKSNTPPLQSITSSTPKKNHTIQPPSKQHHLLDPKVRELQCHIDGRTFTPEPELPVPKIPSLQPWIHSQVRKRAVEKVSLDRVYESGNLVGLTRSQIRQFGRECIKLRPGMVEFLRRFVQEQDRLEQEQELKENEMESQAAAAAGDNEATTGSDSHHPSGSGSGSVPSSSSNNTRGQLWILSVNWSQDLIRGAMDQVFGSEEATAKYLPDSNLICSNLEFAEEGHEILARRRKSEPSTTCTTANTTDSSTMATDNNKEQGGDGDNNSCVHHTSGKVDVNILTGTDKLHAFRDIQRRFAVQHDLAPFETKWAYFGDSTTDLGCLVEADVGIIIGKSKSLLSECERSGIQVVDLVERK